MARFKFHWQGGLRKEFKFKLPYFPVLSSASASNRDSNKTRAPTQFKLNIPGARTTAGGHGRGRGSRLSLRLAGGGGDSEYCRQTEPASHWDGLGGRLHTLGTTGPSVPLPSQVGIRRRLGASG